MEKVIYWLMGERAGSTLGGVWRWLWGLPVEPGGKIAVEVAQESLCSMQQSVYKLTQSVSTVIAAHQRAKEKYEIKEKELRLAERQAMLAHRQGDQEAARLAMAKAIMMENLLPQLAEHVTQTEEVVTFAREKLNRERQKLETYKIQMQNLKDLSEMNESLTAIAKINSDMNIESARSQFEVAQSAIQERHLQVNAEAELSEDHNAKFEDDLAQMTLDDEITRRLQHLADFR